MGILFIGVGSDESRGTLDVLSEYGPKAVALLADVLEHPAFPASQADRLKNEAVWQDFAQSLFNLKEFIYLR